MSLLASLLNASPVVLPKGVPTYYSPLRMNVDNDEPKPKKPNRDPGIKRDRLAENRALILAAIRSGDNTIDKICETTGIGKSAVQRHLEAMSGKEITKEMRKFRYGQFAHYELSPLQKAREK